MIQSVFDALLKIKQNGFSIPNNFFHDHRLTRYLSSLHYLGRCFTTCPGHLPNKQKARLFSRKVSFVQFTKTVQLFVERGKKNFFVGKRVPRKRC